jgi:branched-chain amino acid aminotransferase
LLGVLELITPPLDGTILPGVTRRSILEICRGFGEFKVSERTFYMSEVVEALKEGRVLESFGCGTAAIVTPVKKINYKGFDYKVPIDESINAGPLTKRVWQRIADIQVRWTMDSCNEIDYQTQITLLSANFGFSL